MRRNGYAENADDEDEDDDEGIFWIFVVVVQHYHHAQIDKRAKWCCCPCLQEVCGW